MLPMPRHTVVSERYAPSSVALAARILSPHERELRADALHAASNVRV
jgi:hypothetical protein